MDFKNVKIVSTMVVILKTIAFKYRGSALIILSFSNLTYTARKETKCLILKFTIAQNIISVFKKKDSVPYFCFFMFPFYNKSMLNFLHVFLYFLKNTKSQIFKTEKKLFSVAFSGITSSNLHTYIYMTPDTSRDDSDKWQIRKRPVRHLIHSRPLCIMTDLINSSRRMRHLIHQELLPNGSKKTLLTFDTSVVYLNPQT